MGIDAPAEEEGAALPSVAFANGATANSAQQPSKTLIPRGKTPLNGPTPSLGGVAILVDERPTINPAANKAKTNPLTNCTYYDAVISTRVKKRLCYIIVTVYLSLVNICCNVGYRLFSFCDVTDVSISRYTCFKGIFIMIYSTAYN